MSEPAPFVEGYYLLTPGGDLVYTVATSIVMHDLIDREEVKMFWPWSSADRLSAWTLIVEAVAFGADRGRVYQLAELWRLEDGPLYADRVGAKLEQVAGEWCATRADGTGPAGFAGTTWEALAELGLALGLAPAKVGHVSFPTLLRR